MFWAELCKCIYILNCFFMLISNFVIKGWSELWFLEQMHLNITWFLRCFRAWDQSVASGSPLTHIFNIYQVHLSYGCRWMCVEYMTRGWNQHLWTEMLCLMHKRVSCGNPIVYITLVDIVGRRRSWRIWQCIVRDDMMPWSVWKVGCKLIWIFLIIFWVPQSAE